jgi:hypothetical protein
VARIMRNDSTTVKVVLVTLIEGYWKMSGLADNDARFTPVRLASQPILGGMV